MTLRTKAVQETQVLSRSFQPLPSCASCSLTSEKDAGGLDFRHCSSFGLSVDNASEDSSYQDSWVLQTHQNNLLPNLLTLKTSQ